MRYKSIYVVATKEKVILDFEITKYSPTIEDLVPLLTRIKNRFPESTIQKIVSDEDKAITRAIKAVFPKIVHGFCIFHQLKNVTKRYCDEFKSIENIPDEEKIVYNEICQLIRSRYCHRFGHTLSKYSKFDKIIGTFKSYNLYIAKNSLHNRVSVDWSGLYLS